MKLLCPIARSSLVSPILALLFTFVSIQANAASSLPNFAELVEKNAPAIVNIATAIGKLAHLGTG